jgi:hypothetical protein
MAADTVCELKTKQPKMKIVPLIAGLSQCIAVLALNACATQPAMSTPEAIASVGGPFDNCTVPAGLDEEIQPGQLIMVGEMHGTVEAPAAFGTLACRALARGYAVSVGLELPRDQASPLATYIASDGSARSVTQLLDTPFWQRQMQDGRSSQAMLGLLQKLRAAKQRWPALNVFALEEVESAALPLSASTRDQNMAKRVRAEHQRRPHAVILTLTGNIHNRLKPATELPASFNIPPPMGSLLPDLSPVSLALLTTSGSAWMCSPSCGVQSLRTVTSAHAAPAGAYQQLAASNPYNAEWSLGPGTASLPAVQPGP